MEYNTFKICMFTLFLHTLLFTHCMTQDTSPSAESLSDEAPNSSLTTKPTISPITKSSENECGQPPNETADAVSLKKAMEGLGTDVFTIVDIVATRSNNQRQKIRDRFRELFKKELIDELNSELSGDLRTAVVSLMLTNHQFYAKELYDAMAGLGTDDKAVAEILGSLNSPEIRLVDAAYQTEYKRKLKDDIIDDTSGPFEHLLVQLCAAERKDGRIDHDKAVNVTRTLILAGFDSQLKQTNDEERALISILTSEPFSQLQLIFKEYARLKRKSIQTNIKGRFSKSLEYGLLTIIRRAESKNNYYADELKDAMNGIGTKNRQLTRIIVGRSEIDLEDIKLAYEKKFNSTLIDNVAAETSGEYRNLLMAILRK